MQICPDNAIQDVITVTPGAISVKLSVVSDKPDFIP